MKSEDERTSARHQLTQAPARCPRTPSRSALGNPLARCILTHIQGAHRRVRRDAGKNGSCAPATVRSHAGSGHRAPSKLGCDARAYSNFCSNEQRARSSSRSAAHRETQQRDGVSRRWQSQTTAWCECSRSTAFHSPWQRIFGQLADEGRHPHASMPRQSRERQLNRQAITTDAGNTADFAINL